MSDSSWPNRIGVDGGGTSCRIALIWNGSRADVVTGSANVTTDAKGAVRTILTGIEVVATKVGVQLEDLRTCPVCLGLAGAIGDTETDFVAAALPFERVRVVDDRVTTLKGALGAATGAVAGIGTGSFLAHQKPGEIRLAGGYGLPLGDEASGAWLGREVLRKVLHVADGLAQPSPLTQTVFSQFGNSVAEIVAFSARAVPQDFGQFAPLTLDAADTGDAIGLQVVLAGAGYIVQSLTALDWHPGEPLCLMGGVGPRYREFLPREIRSVVSEPKGNALDAALEMAALLVPETAGGLV